jgi:hypothetical protein
MAVHYHFRVNLIIGEHENVCPYYADVHAVDLTAESVCQWVQHYSSLDVQVICDDTQQDLSHLTTIRVQTTDGALTVQRNRLEAMRPGFTLMPAFADAGPIGAVITLIINTNPQ